MKREAKAQLLKVTLYTLLCIGSFFVVGTIVLVFCAGFQINPFRQRTTSFLVASFMGAIAYETLTVIVSGVGKSSKYETSIGAENVFWPSV